MTPATQRGTEYANGTPDPQLVEAVRAALLTLAANAPAEPKQEERKRAEDTMPLFFKLCSAALISIAALIGVTLYNQLSGSVASQKAELGAMSARGDDLVSKEDYNRKLVEVADTIKKAQATNKSSLEYWREANQAEDRKLRNLQDDTRTQIRDLERELQRLRERLAVLERESALQGPPAVKPKKDGKN